MSNKIDLVYELIASNPKTTVSEVMKKLRVKRQYAYNLMSMARRRVKKGDNKRELEKITEILLSVPPTPSEPLPVTMFDVVNHPPHYKVGGVETIDFIEAKGLNYHLGNVVKYITRADHKGDRLENLKKAQWYLAREIENAAR